jgi:RNA polymerase sigma factor (sigma-70 family)
MQQNSLNWSQNMHKTAHELDIAGIYAATAPLVASLVARNITAPPSVIEEACQTAWSALVAHQDEVAPESVVGWLTTTAMRAALHMLKTGHRDLSLDDPVQMATVAALPARAPTPERLTELRERLAEVHQLPSRQRRMVWLQGFGYDYEEIAQRTGDSRRTVERQLGRARRRLRPVS